MRNLAANGSFLIDHDQIFLTWNGVRINDFIATFWYVSGMDNVVWLNALNNGKGVVSFKGYFKKNGVLTLSSTFMDSYPILGSRHYHITAFADIKMVQGISSVISVGCRRGLGNTICEENKVVANRGRGRGKDLNVYSPYQVCSFKETNSTISLKSHISFEIMVEGEYTFNIYTFNETASYGKNKNYVNDSDFYNEMGVYGSKVNYIVDRFIVGTTGQTAFDLSRNVVANKSTLTDSQGGILQGNRLRGLGDGAVEGEYGIDFYFDLNAYPKQRFNAFNHTTLSLSLIHI